jgi:hypothetical protein
MAFVALCSKNNFPSGDGESVGRGALLDIPYVEHEAEYAIDQSPAATEVRSISPDLPHSPATAASAKRPTLNASSSDVASAVVIPKRLNFQEYSPVLVRESELAAAKTALASRFNEVDVKTAEELVRVALDELCNSICTAESLKMTLSQRGSLVALRSLEMLEVAHKANKMVKLSYEELLLFVAVKSAKVHHEPYSKNPHKSLFMLLTGRSNNWWDTHHRWTLVRIAQKPRRRDPPKPRQYSMTRSEYRLTQMTLATQRRQRWQRENKDKVKYCYVCHEIKTWPAFNRTHLKGKDVPTARCTDCTYSAARRAALVA